MTDKLSLGDTPEQLNVKCANWVDVLVIDGKAYTAEQVKELLKERDALAAELSKLCEFRDEVVGVMNESSGVVGWHKNHTVATWGELLPVVPDFESPQQCLRDIQAGAVKNFVEFNAGRYSSAFEAYINDALKTYLSCAQQGGE